MKNEDKHTLKPIKLVRIKDTDSIGYLERLVEVCHDEGMNGGIVDDFYIDYSYSVNDFMFYVAKDDSYWMTAADKKKIKGCIL